MYSCYQNHPEVAVPILVARLNEKINEWIELAYAHKAVWQTQLRQSTKNLARHYFNLAKNNEMRQLQQKFIYDPFLNENNEEKKDLKNGRAKVHAYEEAIKFGDKYLVEEVLDLVCRFVRRQQISQSEKSEIKFVLYHFLPEILGIFEGSVSDDDYDNLSNFRIF